MLLRVGMRQTGSKLFLGLAGVEGGSGLLDVGQQLHPLVDLFAELVAQTVRLKWREKKSVKNPLQSKMLF